ncbi:major facilitator transporter [Caballeronia pedi]|uniref:Major facilitator transporter n=1 Tax=Caballeronia pedi TaxID=1777141 RepID=A0A158DC77_9BURK|nr:MFS transporter [Caballeronia pedi]SAK92158.1 major facilitator transporter [Caballeronia pedi]
MDHTAFGQQVIRTVKWKIVPFAFILYFFNYLDRVNVGFAALQMNRELDISPTQFGTLASVFFVPYLLFQIPANYALQRLGARRWISFIVVVWGAITALTFFAQNVTHVAIARFLLGIFEAGFFPGMIFYLACWFPARERAKVTSLFMLAIAVSSVVAGPMSGWIVQHVHIAGFDGWRWLFAIEGVPTILLGCLAFVILVDSPAHAKWLTAQQRTWLEAELQQERGAQSLVERPTLRMVLGNAALWKLALSYMLIQAASQASNYWLPTQVKGFAASLTDTQTGLIMALPFVCAMVTMPLWAAHSDRTGERKWHAALPMLLAGIAFFVIASVPSMPLRMVGLALFGVGILSFYGPFWSIPPAMLSPAGLALSIAFINSCSSLGGFLANQALGHVAQSYGSYGVFIVEAALCVAAFCVLLTMRIPRPAPNVAPSTEPARA